MEPLNWSALREHCAGDETLLKEVVAIFRRELEPLLRDVRDAVKADDAEAIRRSAHRLKGALVTVAARPSVDAAHALEVGGVSGAGDRLSILETELLRLTAALSRVGA